MATPFTYRKELVDYSKLLYDKGMLAGSDGNISLRLDDDRIMVTPGGLAKGRMAPDDMVIVDINGKHLQGTNKATSELLMHLNVYQKRPDIKAIVHSHAPFATSFAVAGVELKEYILPEVVVFIGGIPLTDYAPPGTDAVPKALDRHLEKNNAFLL
jgi:L-fuculose-phosphate aldolase